MSGDDWLWDRSGEPDPVVESLEQRLRVLRHRGEAAKAPSAGVTPPTPLRRWLWPVGLGGLAAALLAGWWLTSAEPASVVRLAIGASGAALPARIDASTRDVHVELGNAGDVTVRRGSALRLERLDPELARLFLERGALEAFVAPTVQARWLEVGTPSARCVDLGCRYTLTVDDHGIATVVVELGRVAFADGRREVVVPFGATCRATPEGGAGTPRYLADQDTPFAGVLDRLDDTSVAPIGSQRRLDLTNKLLSVASQDHRTLSLWHLLQDDDARVRDAVADWLVRRYGRPEDLAPDVAPDDPQVLAAWRRVLQPLWWPP